VNQYGRYYVSTLLGMSGSGATPQNDGMNSGGGPITGHNVEWVELNFPLLHLFRRHIVDGAGAGKHRGGFGAEMALTPYDAPQGKIRGVALGVAGLRNAGQGTFGGFPSAPSLLTLIKSTRLRENLGQSTSPTDLTALGGEASLLPYCDFDLNEGDVLLLTSGGGGGYGDPLERDPAAVLKDVQDSLVSENAARDMYGVVVHAGQLDKSAMEATRSRLRKEAECRGRFRRDSRSAAPGS